MRLPLSAWLASLLLGLPTAPAAAPWTSARPPLAKGAALRTPAPVERLIVKLHPDARYSDAERVAGLGRTLGQSLRLHRAMSGGAQVVRLAHPLSAAQATALAERLARQPGVEYAAPDVLRRPTTVPDDPEWPLLWNLMAPDASSDGALAVGGANLPAAWDLSTGSNSTIVAVVDTGVLPHPEFSARLLPGYDFIGTIFLANDGNGRDNDASDPGNWVSAAEAGSGHCADVPEHDSNWHGTQIAGTIAATGNNASALAGFDWQTRILPVRVLGKCGGFDSDIIDGIRWAAGFGVVGVPANPHPADVINLSLGAPGPCSTPYALLFSQLRARGISVVVSAGNDAAYTVSAPANCPAVIAVTAHAIDGTSSYFANVGAHVDLSAPGGGWGTAPDGSTQGGNPPILALKDTGTTSPTGSHAIDTVEGTSLAAAHVSGTIALMHALMPTVSPDQVRILLTGNARSHPAGSWCTLTGKPQSGRCGSGLLDVEKTLLATQVLARQPSPPPASGGGGGGGALDPAALLLLALLLGRRLSR